MNNTIGQLVDNREDILRFITGKKAWFTLVSEETGNSLSFRFTPSKKHYGTVFVSVSIGGNYCVIGGIGSNGVFRCKPIWVSWRYGSTPVPNTELYYKSLVWFWNAIHSNVGLERVRFYHVGRCSVCGHKLTSVGSIKIGIGPGCLKRIE